MPAGTHQLERQTQVGADLVGSVEVVEHVDIVIRQKPCG